MTHPHQTASGVITESPLVLTDAVTDSGVTGRSIVFTYTTAALKPTAELIQNLEPLVTAESLAPTEIEQKLGKRFRLLGTQGLVAMALEANASDYVMPDVMKIGGVTGWMRAATLAQAKGIRMSNRLWPEISARLLCCTPTAHWLEYADWWSPIIRDPLHVKDGVAIVDNGIGSGVEWNEASVSAFLA